MTDSSKYTDATLLTFGKHKGKSLLACPASWLLWYKDQTWANNQLLLDYIKDNEVVLMQEVDLERIKRNES